MVSTDLLVVLIDGVRYQLITPESEDWLENVIKSNSEHIFGPDSFYFDIKKLIRSKVGVASIPDGYVIYFNPKPKWAVVEVELASHPIYDHLIPQLSKFDRGIEDSATRRQIVDILYTAFSQDEVLRARLKRRIETTEVHKFISELVFQDPLIVVVIDEQTEDLKEALRSLRVNVQVVEFKAFQREGISGDVNAFAFKPLSAAPVVPPKQGDGTESRSGPEPKFSQFGAHKAKAKSPRVTIDNRTVELLHTPGGISLEEIHQIICKEWPDKDPAVLKNTTKRRLHGHLQNKLGIHIVKDAAGKYFIK